MNKIDILIGKELKIARMKRRLSQQQKVIQSLMGHSTEDMSLYYAFTTEEEKADAVKKRTQ